jgi:peptidylprolyl isomerase
MTNRSLAAPALAAAAAALALAGCGSSSSSGITAAPSAGLTQAPASTTPTTTTPTTTTTATPQPTVKLPAAFNTKPKITVPSGPPPKKLEKIDLIKGTGPAAAAGSTVSVQYVGYLYSNGKQFTSSYGTPVTTEPISDFIAGWQEGIPGMREGGRRELIIPASLAYGKVSRPASGAGDVAIPANAALIFVIDLHAVS